LIALFCSGGKHNLDTARRNAAAGRRANHDLHIQPQRLRESVLPLAYFPQMFKESDRMPGCREIIAHPNYLVFYRILSDRIKIEMVAHGRRNFPITR